MGSGDAEPTAFALDVTTGADGQTIVAVAGEIDLATADRFASAIAAGLASGPVFLDLSAVSFMDSAGVRAVNAMLRAATEHGHELRVAPAMQDSVVQVLELTGMMGLLTIAAR